MEVFIGYRFPKWERLLVLAETKKNNARYYLHQTWCVLHTTPKKENRKLNYLPTSQTICPPVTCPPALHTHRPPRACCCFYKRFCLFQRLKYWKTEGFWLFCCLAELASQKVQCHDQRTPDSGVTSASGMARGVTLLQYSCVRNYCSRGIAIELSRKCKTRKRCRGRHPTAYTCLHS